MKWICPICQQENQNKWSCDCGFDESKNYEKYKVIKLLSEENIQKYIDKKGDEDSFCERYVSGILISCLQRAAELGNLKAQYELGRLYYDEIVD